MKVPEKLALARLEVVGNGIATSLKLSQLCVSAGSGAILLVAGVGPQSGVKAFAAILNTTTSCNITAKGTGVISDYAQLRRVEGYTIRYYRMPHNTIHFQAVAKTDRFLNGGGLVSIWQLLSGPEYTTPLLREWMPYIAEQMKEQGYQQRLLQFQTKCRMIRMTTDQLDGIVGHGLRTGAISIPTQRTAVCDSSPMSNDQTRPSEWCTSSAAP